MKTLNGSALSITAAKPLRNIA